MDSNTEPFTPFEPTSSGTASGWIIALSVIGSAVLHGGVMLLNLPEPKAPEPPPVQKMVMVQTAPPKPPEIKQPAPPKPKPKPPEPVQTKPKSKSVAKRSAPQKAKASRPILSSKAPVQSETTVSENMLSGSRGTGYGTEKGEDFGSTSPVGVDGGTGGTEAVEAPPPPPPPPLVNARPKGNVQPDYPEIAQQNNWEGRVIVKAFVNPDGTVAEVQVAKSSGHVELDNAAMEAVKRTTFEPARRGEEVVSAWVRVPITFSLQ
ncbi:energy transducer TonB [Gloeobacter violaceus]|uniref:Glr1815 protein n=1 Tax=Gloeobacter violaceus (strain ATCC 29082 / PCC 7421) TaxID=251221 RepID=Q7NJL7_GLOVI|nr:energy transducer TonB [Gloeobacter violaceus]BAC89756.1 glr1815 [Gloeobacter violaceus PCC 7421]